MRPLFHPSLDDVTVEGILHALSDPVRVEIMSRIVTAECPQTCSTFLECPQTHRKLPKSTLSQHFKVLREAGLIKSQRKGVEMLNTTRCEEIQGRFPGLLQAILNAQKIQAGLRAKKKKR